MISSARKSPAHIIQQGRKIAARKERKYFSKVVGKALDILEILKRNPHPLSLNELTQKTGLAKSSVFRILHTLEVSGYLCRNEAGHYSLSLDIRPLVPIHVLTRLVEIATPQMKDLSRKFRETVSLAVLFDNHIEVVQVIDSPQLIRMGNTVGRIIPPHASSLGKSITAFQPEELRDKLQRSFGMNPFTEKTITGEVELKRELERVRARGFSTDLEECVKDGCCYGGPIFADGEQTIAAISLSLPKMRLDQAVTQEEIAAAVKKAAEAISRELRSAGI
jgi:IclR family acetate operon transcriptional repressor